VRGAIMQIDRASVTPGIAIRRINTRQLLVATSTEVAPSAEC